MLRDPREHCNCIGKAKWQGSTFPISLHKDKAVAPGGKLLLAKNERWRESSDPDLFSFSYAKLKQSKKAAFDLWQKTLISTYDNSH